MEITLGQLAAQFEGLLIGSGLQAEHNEAEYHANDVAGQQS